MAVRAAVAVWTAVVACLVPTAAAADAGPHATGTAGPAGAAGPADTTVAAGTAGTADREAAAARGSETAARRAAAEGVAWGPCPAGDGLPAPVECGTVTVPVDYADPAGESIALHVSRLPAAGPPEERQGALLYSPGGPGGDGISFPLYPGRSAEKIWQQLHQAYDFVGYSPRGVGRSAPLSCRKPGTASAAVPAVSAAASGGAPAAAPRGPSEAFKQQRNAEAAAYAAGCLAGRGAAGLARFTTADNARDLHTLRAALGEERLNFLGVSYGSYLGAVYATLFPETVRRMALDSVVNPDPDLIWYGANLAQSRAFESRWTDFKRWVAAHHDVYGLGRTARRVQHHYDLVRDALAARPVPGGTGPGELHDAFVPVIYTDGAWPRTAGLLAAYHRGRPGPLLAGARTAPEDAARAENARAVYTAVQCAEGSWPRAWDRWDRDHTALARVAPFETWRNAWLNLPCAHWPVPAARPVDVGAAPGTLEPVLLLAATGDAATPHAGAVETRRRLPGSRLVTEQGAGNHGVTGGNACVDERLAAYLLFGTVPETDVRCPPRPAPKPAPRPG